MKKTIFIFAAMAAAFLAAPAAQAQKAAVVAVIDTQHIQRTSLAGKDIQIQIDALRTKFQSEMQGEEEKLRKEAEDLQRQKDILAPEAFQARQKQYQDKVAAAQRLAQEKRRQLELAVRQSSNDLQRGLVPVLRKIMDARKITLVVDKSQVIMQGAGLEITTEVIEALDATLPSVKVELPKAQPQ